MVGQDFSIHSPCGASYLSTQNVRPKYNDHIFFDLSISSCHYSESVSQAVSDLLFSKYSVNQGIQVIQVRHVIHLIHVIHEIHIIHYNTIRAIHSMQGLQVNQVMQIIKVLQIIQLMS